MKSLKKRFINYMEYYGKIKSRQVLLNLSDRQLEDAGISKDLLLKGTSHWPWREAAEPTAPHARIHLAHQNDATSATSANEAYEQAVADLEAMSDRELLDMGISRGEIRHAVKYGTQEQAA